MRDRYWAALVLALLVAIGGLATVEDPSTGPEPSQDGTVTVLGEDLSFDAATVYERVGEMHGKQPSELPEVTVVLRERPASEESYAPTAFERSLGIEPQRGDVGPAAYARGQRVVLYTDVVESPADRERVLAHEFAHVVQFEENVPLRVSRGFGPTGADEEQLQTAVVEGAASYVEQQYAAEYLDEAADLPTWADRRANATQLGAYVVAHYHFGNRYVDERVDSVADLDGVYDDPPRTSEQLLHGDGSTEELPTELPVAVDDEEYRIDDRRTKGELFVRIVLEGELGLDRAADAAAGWGNDELVVLDDGADPPDYAWALAWDTPAEADAFEAAKRDFLDRHVGERHDGLWHGDDVTYGLERAGDDVVVLFVGDADFVERADATADGTGVTVTVDDASRVRSVDGGDRTEAVAEPIATTSVETPTTDATP